MDKEAKFTLAGSFPKSANEIVCAGISGTEGQESLFVRTFSPTTSGQLLPTRYGVTLPLQKCHELQEGVRALANVMTSSKVVARIRKNDAEEVRIGIGVYRGRPLIYLQTFAASGGTSEFLPTKEGISLNVDFLPHLLEAVESLAKAVASRDTETSAALPTSAPVSQTQLVSNGIGLNELSPDFVHEIKDLYIDESGFLVNPELLQAEAPRKTRDERWGTVPAPHPRPARRDGKDTGNLFQRIRGRSHEIAGAFRPRAIGRPSPMLKCPLCDFQTEYGGLYPHIKSAHPDRNPKVVMAEFNQEYKKNRAKQHIR